MTSSRASLRRAVPAAFLLFAAVLLVVGPAEASRTTDARSGLAPTSLEQLPSTSADPVDTVPRFGFGEDLSLLDPERGPGGFVVFARETSRCELIYARNNPLKYVDPDGKETASVTNSGEWGPHPGGPLPWKEELWLWAGVAAVGSTAVTGGLLADAVGFFGAAAAIAPAAGPIVQRASDALGRAREMAVAELTGGRVVNDLKLMTQVGGRLEGVKVDVIGKAGELVAVGGPAKANQLGALGDHLTRLSNAAAARGVAAQAYFQEGTPKAALDLARKLLGEQNVKIFRVAPSS